MTTTEVVAIAGAILTGLGGPQTVKMVGSWIAARREKREALEAIREEHRHKEAIADIEAEADDVTGKHEIATIAGLAKVVHEQSTEIILLRASERDHDRRCDEKIAAAIAGLGK